MLEADHTRSVRVQAPIAMVWGEIDSLERLMRQVPEVAYFRVESDGRTAHVSTRLGWGPLNWRFASVTLEKADPPHHLEWRSSAAALRLDFQGVFQLSRAPRVDETDLTYRAILRCEHRFVGRLRGALASFLEGHVNGLADRVATLAAQHADAQLRLARPPDFKAQE